MKTMRFPGTFHVGSDILKDISSFLACYGKKVIMIGGKHSLEAVRDQLEQGFEETDMQITFAECGKIASYGEIARIESCIEVQEAEIICGVGGGSCMDIARTIANRNEKALVMIPTTVASDSPCSNVSVFYAEDGASVVGDEIFHKCPDMILVDTYVIANAPSRHLAAGMADALATYYEASTCKHNPKGTGITETAMMIAKLCREIVLRDGLAAFAAVKNHIVTPELENVVEANCFLSGVGGLNTGCAAAHGIGDYLCRLPGGHSFMHGERVFVGLIVQLILEQYPEEEIKQLIGFGQAVGLPVGLGDIGVENISSAAEELAKGLQDDHFMVNLSCDYSPDILAGAMVYAQILADGCR